jgi:DNA-binding transcriptional ArsR family regulator
MRAVLDSALPAMQRMVALVIAEATNSEEPDRGAWPSVDRIAMRAGMTVRSVQRHLADLEADKVLTVERRTGSSSIYRLDLRQIVTPDTQSPPSGCHPTPVTLSPPPPSGCHPGGDSLSPELVIESEVESGNEPEILASLVDNRSFHLEAIAEPAIASPSKLRIPKDQPTGFLEFWQAYPATERRNAKSKCLDVWRRHKLELQHRVILAHVKAMAATKSWRGGYEPAPLTYLNQRRWEDGLPNGNTNAHQPSRQVAL